MTTVDETMFININEIPKSRQKNTLNNQTLPVVSSVNINVDVTYLRAFFVALMKLSNIGISLQKFL